MSFAVRRSRIMQIISTGSTRNAPKINYRKRSMVYLPSSIARILFALHSGEFDFDARTESALQLAESST